MSDNADHSMVSSHLAPSSGERVTRELSLDTRETTNSGTSAEDVSHYYIIMTCCLPTSEVSAEVSIDRPRVH